MRQNIELWVNKASNRTDAGEVRDRILESLATGRLDLRHCRARAVIELPTELINALPHLRAIALPRSVGQWPPGNGGIYRSGLNSELVINGPDLTLVRVYGGTHVRTSGRGRKIKVIYHDASGAECGAGVALGNAYYARKNGSIDFTNINTLFQFERDPRVWGGFTIVCRHLALFEALMRQRHEQEKKSHGTTANWATCREERLRHIARAQNAALDLRYDELLAHAPEQYLVGHSEWGRFLHDQFSHMQPEEMKNMVMSSQGHAMTLTLKTKIENGVAHYVIEFYDPNHSYTHTRIEKDDLSGLLHVTMELLLPDGDIDYYYKTEQSQDHVPFSTLAVLPADAHRRALSDEWFSHSSPSVVKEFLPNREMNNPLRFYARAKASASLGGLYEAAAACPDRRSRVALLRLPGPHGGSGFADAISHAATATVTEYGNVLLRARANGLIDNDDLGLLLQSGAAEGAQAGRQDAEHVNTFSALAKIARNARERGWLNEGVCGRVLATPLRMAAQYGPAAAVQEICKIMLEGDTLTPAEAAALFTPGLMAAAVQGCIRGTVRPSDSLVPLTDAVTKAKLAGLLTEEEVVDILRIKLDQSTLESFDQPPKVLTEWGVAVLNARERGALSSEGLAELMFPKNIEAVSPKIDPQKMQEQYKAWTAIANTALQKGWLTQDQIARRLISAENRKPWLAWALEHGVDKDIMANYSQLISGVALNNKSRTTVRRELNSAVRGWFGRRRPEFRNADPQAWQHYKKVLHALR